MIEYNDMYEYNDEDGGIQFQPYDDELIDDYLIPKLEGKPRNEITTKDVYSTEPWLLDHPMGSFFKKNEWYYFVTRTQLSKKKIGCGKKAKRKITRDDDSGSWRANAKENIPDKDKTMVIGEKQTLAFIKSKVNNKKKQKSGDGTSCDIVVPGSNSSWIMTEYMLPEIDGKFRELVICKIHVIENSNNNKGHEASTSNYHHHHHIDSSTSEQQPTNFVDHGTLLAPALEQQRSNMYHHHTDPSTSVQQPSNIVNHETFVDPFLEQQPMDWYHHEYFLGSFNLEQQPTNIIWNVQENNINYHEAFIPHLDHVFLSDSTTKQQPVNEAHGHVPEIPLIGSENNDQVFEASHQVSVRDEQVYIDAPLFFSGTEQGAKEGGGGEWFQGLINSLATVSLPMEEDHGILNYNTSLFPDQDLLD